MQKRVLFLFAGMFLAQAVFLVLQYCDIFYNAPIECHPEEDVFFLVSVFFFFFFLVVIPGVFSKYLGADIPHIIRNALCGNIQHGYISKERSIQC